MLETFYSINNNQGTMEIINEFINAPKNLHDTNIMPAISLFSGAGLSDIGYEQAGFTFIVQAELDEKRASLCAKNFANSTVIDGDIVSTYKEVIQHYRKANVGRLHLLSVTPPCQGMSSSNPGRGKLSKTEERDKRNRLILNSIPIIHALNPRTIVVENVQQILKEKINVDNEKYPILDVFREALSPDYVLFSGVIQTANYGIPQTRKRAIVVAIHRDEPVVDLLHSENILPWPKATHSEKCIDNTLPWVTLREWFLFQQYSPLDSSNKSTSIHSTDILHQVPNYEKNPHRYLWISDIPQHSGKNAYQNDKCHNCNLTQISEGLIYCPSCHEPLINRPYVKEKSGEYRLIKGFHSSYRRMASDKPAPTVMTSSNHLGSDYNIHPWENRLLSIRECAELQTIPRFYDWSPAFDTNRKHVTRHVIGEALPSWFTFIHGLLLKDLLNDKFKPEYCEKLKPTRKR